MKAPEGIKTISVALKKDAPDRRGDKRKIRVRQTIFTK